MSNQADFLRPTHENTLTWGDTQSIGFLGTAAEAVAAQSAQLVHVGRKRPTTFTVLVTLVLGQGWAGEGPWTFALAVIVGVGQAKTTMLKQYAIPVPANNSQPVADVFTVPATAMQCQGELVGVVAVPGQHDAQLTILAAPVYA